MLIHPRQVYCRVPGFFGRLGFFLLKHDGVKMHRYCFYIDGFNVYHALNDTPPGAKKNRFPYRKYKWLNYRKLAESIIGAKDTIGGIFYFTAFAYWKPPQVALHREYIKVLRSAGVETIRGFMRKETKCHLCQRYFVTHEEKRTDVNIALKLFGDAIDDLYDRALIISADSDLLPVIKTIHKYFPDKETGVMLPIGRSSYELRENADFRRKMTEKLLKDSQFPNKVQTGKETIHRPKNWS